MNKNRLLQLLMAHRDRPVSGQEISGELQVSRTAVWKQIEELRKNGYEIEAASRRGYRLVRFPDRVGTEEIMLHLTTERLGRSIIYNDTVTSTQEIVREQAEKGAGEGLIAVANEQVQGRGRLGRAWQSSPEQGIWMSLLLRPQVPPRYAPQLTLLSAVALAEALDLYLPEPTAIKWPNDIRIHKKKAAGILTEMQADMDEVQTVIVGMGINVNQDDGGFTGELAEKAASIRQYAGVRQSRPQIIASILKSYESWYNEYLTNGFGAVKDAWSAKTDTLGSFIQVETSRQTVEGTALRITDEGALQVQKTDGSIQTVHSGEILDDPPTE